MTETSKQLRLKEIPWKGINPDSTGRGGGVAHRLSSKTWGHGRIVRVTLP